MSLQNCQRFAMFPVLFLLDTNPALCYSISRGFLRRNAKKLPKFLCKIDHILNGGMKP